MAGRLFLGVMFLAAMGIIGCQRNEPISQGSVSGPVADAGDEFQTLLQMCRDGRAEQAVERLREVDVKQLVTNSTVEALTTSESQFMSMSSREQSRLQEEIPRVHKPLRELLGAGIAKGDEAIGRQEPELAREYFRAINELGEALQQDDKMLLIQKIGELLSQQASERLNNM